MIKKILFDLDNTLINWKKEYRALSMNEAGIYDIEKIQKFDEAYTKYEESVEHITMDSLVKYILSLDLGITNEQAIDIVMNDKNRYEKSSKEEIEVLEYLSSKYELVVVTNWFLDIQKTRLERAGILKYFKEIYASDEYRVKPNKDMFIKAMENCTANECIMIGDSIQKDLKPAIELGMKAILVGNDKNYKCINSILDLKEML